MTKKISALTLSEVTDQLQMLNYVARNTPAGLATGDRILLQKLQRHQQRLRDKAGAP